MASSKKEMGDVGGLWLQVKDVYANGRLTKVFVPKGQKIKELKESLFESIDGLGAREAKLIFGGKVLKDEDLVETVMHADSSTMKALAADPDQRDADGKDLLPTLLLVRAAASRPTRSRSDDLGASRKAAPEPGARPGTSPGRRHHNNVRAREAKDTPAPVQSTGAPEEHPRRAAARAAFERAARQEAAALTPPAASERRPEVAPDARNREPSAQAQAEAPMLDAASIPLMQNLYLQQMYHFGMWQQAMMAYYAHAHTHGNGQMSPNGMAQGGIWPPAAVSPFPNQHTEGEARAAPPAERQGRANWRAAPAQDQAAVNGRPGANGAAGGIAQRGWVGLVFAELKFAVKLLLLVVFLGGDLPFEQQIGFALGACLIYLVHRQLVAMITRSIFGVRGGGEPRLRENRNPFANNRDRVNGANAADGNPNEENAFDDEGRDEVPPGVVRRIMDVSQGFIEEGGGWAADVQYLFASFLCSLLPSWNPQPTPTPIDPVDADAHQGIQQNDNFNGNPEVAHAHAD